MPLPCAFVNELREPAKLVGPGVFAAADFGLQLVPVDRALSSPPMAGCASVPDADSNQPSRVELGLQIGLGSSQFGVGDWVKGSLGQANPIGQRSERAGIRRGSFFLDRLDQLDLRFQVVFDEPRPIQDHLGAVANPGGRMCSGVSQIGGPPLQIDNDEDARLASIRANANAVFMQVSRTGRQMGITTDPGVSKTNTKSQHRADSDEISHP